MEEKYNFSCVYEPSEQQLMCIMKEVAEEARIKAINTEKKFKDYLKQLISDVLDQYYAGNEK